MKISLFFLTTILIGSCIAQDFPSISAEDAFKMQSENDSLIFVDVRTVGEFEGDLGHIEEAILIPLHNLEKEFKNLTPHKNKEMIVYCRSGNRSQGATRFLRAKGFKATNMLGGIRSWNKIKSDIEK